MGGEEVAHRNCPFVIAFVCIFFCFFCCSWSTLLKGSGGGGMRGEGASGKERRVRIHPSATGWVWIYGCIRGKRKGGACKRHPQRGKGKEKNRDEVYDSEGERERLRGAGTQRGGGEERGMGGCFSSWRCRKGCCCCLEGGGLLVKIVLFLFCFICFVIFFLFLERVSFFLVTLGVRSCEGSWGFGGHGVDANCGGRTREGGGVVWFALNFFLLSCFFLAWIALCCFFIFFVVFVVVSPCCFVLFRTSQHHHHCGVCGSRRGRGNKVHRAKRDAQAREGRNKKGKGRKGG